MSEPPETTPPPPPETPETTPPTPDPAEGQMVPAGQEPDGEVLPQFVTRLVSVEQQVGMHTIAALQHPEIVAVISTVAAGPDGSQHIMSVGLDPETLSHVQELLNNAQEEKTQRVPCVGFQCVLEDRKRAVEEKDQP